MVRAWAVRQGLQPSDFVTESKYKVSAATYSIDFSKNDETAFNGFAAACEGRDIGVLGLCSSILVVFPPKIAIFSQQRREIAFYASILR